MKRLFLQTFEPPRVDLCEFLLFLVALLRVVEKLSGNRAVFLKRHLSQENSMKQL